MLRLLGIVIQWGFVCLGVLAFAGGFLWTLDPKTAKLPTAADLNDVVPTPPPNWNVIPKDQRIGGVIAESQQIGGLFVSSGIADPGLDQRHAAMARNKPIALPTDHNGSGLYLLAEPFGGVPTQRNYRRYPRMAVALVNATDELLEFDSLHWTLPIIQEAVSPEGIWQPIEFFPDPANSDLHVPVYLPGRHYWYGVMRTYRGDFPTTCRLSLRLPTGQRLVSNEFQQAISISQFQSHERHQPPLTHQQVDPK